MVAQPELDTGTRQAGPGPSWDAGDAEALVGQILSRTYRLERLLVEGGMGAVYLGRHLRTGGLCAVKVLHQRAAERLEIYERFQDEARISCALRHPNIVQVTDLDLDESGTPFLVMELLEGEDLQERLDRDGRLPPQKALELARQVGSALSAAHGQGIVHRDLKPQNLYIARTEVAGQMVERFKVLDFGLSKVPRPADRATRDMLVLGTPRYLAPEAARGMNSKLDGRADQFSLAVILYRALSGKLPFDGDDVGEVLHQVVFHQQKPLAALLPLLPATISAAIERALSKKKEERFDTIAEFVRALTDDTGKVALPAQKGELFTAPLPLPRVQGAALNEAPTQSLATGRSAGGPAFDASWVAHPPAASPPPPASGGSHADDAPERLHKNDDPWETAAVPRMAMVGRFFQPDRCAVAALLGAIASLPLLFAVGTIGVQKAHSAGRLSGPAELLRQADGMLAAHRFRDAVTAAERALASSSGTPAWREAALSRKQRAEAEEGAQRGFARLQKALLAQDTAAAVAAFADIPPTSMFHGPAQGAAAQAFARFSQDELGRAEAARLKGHCDEFTSSVQKVLAVLPDQPQALAARWAPCPVEETRTTQSFGPTPPALLMYPPLRTGDAYGAAASYGNRRTLDTADQLLVDAERLQAKGQMTAAAERAHLLLREGDGHRQRALFVLGAAACARGKMALAFEAYDRLSGGRRGELAAACEKARQEARDNGRFAE